MKKVVRINPPKPFERPRPPPDDGPDTTEDGSQEDEEDGIDSLTNTLGIPDGGLKGIFSYARSVALEGGLNSNFIVYALHGDNICIRTLPSRMFYHVSDVGVHYHQREPDYRMHGFVFKRPLMGDPDGIVCEVWQGDIMEVAMGGLSHDDYEEMIELS
tara:strand:+ start:7325 stop:7798 length:474 start_codon:yes stop_codon:yes gene_type:complete